MTEKEKQIKIKIILTDNPEQARALYKELKAIRYQQGKERARAEAQKWQQSTSPKSWGEIAQAVAQLERIAKRWGLVQEFKREGII